MNRFKALKANLTNEQVVQRYLGLPEKRTSTGLWYKSPFRKERTASLCVSQKGIHDFGDSSHYDIISFIEKYFNVNPSQACDILCNDFGLSFNNPYQNRQVLDLLKRKRQEEQEIKQKVEDWYNQKMQTVCDELMVLRACINALKRTTYFSSLAILYEQETKLEVEFEILFDIAKNEEIKSKMFLEELK